MHYRNQVDLIGTVIGTAREVIKNDQYLCSIILEVEGEQHTLIGKGELGRLMTVTMITGKSAWITGKLSYSSPKGGIARIEVKDFCIIGDQSHHTQRFRS